MPSPELSDTETGAPGGPTTCARPGSGAPACGVAATLAASPAPTRFTARTSKVYSVPASRPITVWLRAPASPAMSTHPLDETDVAAAWRTWYLSMGLPLCHAASQVSIIVPGSVPSVADRSSGASGWPRRGR